MNKIDFILEFKNYTESESALFYSIFNNKNIPFQTICEYYKLFLESVEIGYKYNAHVLYLPFENNDELNNSDYFIIKNKKEILLKVYFKSNYDIQRIEDNLTALYY